MMKGKDSLADAVGAGSSMAGVAAAVCITVGSTAAAIAAASAAAAAVPVCVSLLKAFAVSTIMRNEEKAADHIGKD